MVFLKVSIRNPARRVCSSEHSPRICRLSSYDLYLSRGLTFWLCFVQSLYIFDQERKTCSYALFQLGYVVNCTYHQNVVVSKYWKHLFSDRMVVLALFAAWGGFYAETGGQITSKSSILINCYVNDIGV